MNAVDRTKAGVASGTLSMTRMVGGTFGVAALGALVASVGRHDLAQSLPSVRRRRARSSSTRSAAAPRRPARRTPCGRASERAFVDALGAGLTIAAIATALAAVAALVADRSASGPRARAGARAGRRPRLPWSSRCTSSPTVDRGTIARLRAEDHFFWIDLVAPDARTRSTRLGAALDLHPVALEDTLEFGQRPKIDAVRRPRPARLLHARATGDRAGRAAGGAHLHLRRVHRDGPPRRTAPRSTTCTTIAAPRADARRGGRSSTACSTG